MYFLIWKLLVMYVRSSSPAPFVRLLIDTQQIQDGYTLGPTVPENPYHIPLIRSQLTQAIPLVAPEIYDEVVMACNEFIPITKGNRQNHRNMFKKKQT